MRLLPAFALVLALAGCSSKSRYQGDVVLGGFDFQASFVTSTCPEPSSDFPFSGVLSYDTASQRLFLDTDGVTDDDHVGTLSGTHFVLQGNADRTFSCGPVHIIETLEGDLYASVPGGGCDGGAPGDLDGGTTDGGVIESADAGVQNFQPLLACGQITDDAAPVPDAGAPVPDGGPCTACEIVYHLVGTRQ
jgi:hypothetical protein